MSARRLAVGLMSGTSADGVTAALVKISADKIRVVRHRTYPYPSRLKKLILDAPKLRAPELSKLNFSLGAIFAEAAIRISKGARPFVIGSHGQTIWHGPNDNPPNTLQIAEPCVIAEKTGIAVVADFRPRDIAAGGQGAPLAPAFDLFLFGRGPLRAIVNIGGIANVSFVSRGKLWSAFDTGPGNALMDEVIRRTSNEHMEMDLGGRLAARGRVDQRALKRLLSLPYFRKLPPKSLDRSVFGPDFLNRHFPRIASKNVSDILATLAELTARSIQASILQAPISRPVEIVISGGGALNTHLMHRLASLLSPIPIVKTTAYGLDVMAKEAACFAWLAARALEGKTNHCPAATGARQVRILGKIIRSK